MYDYIFFVFKKSYLRYIRAGSLFSFEVDLHVIGHVVAARDHHVSSRMEISERNTEAKSGGSL